MRAFFESYDVLALPVSQVPPFPATEEFPTSIHGRPRATYLDCLRPAFLTTDAGGPAIAVPAGTTADGLPIGIQLVAPHGADRRLLETAAAFEAAIDIHS
jgi:amidase